jgi:hypothetical protein
LRVALFLLTSTATAHAECAWVLWMKTSATEWDPAQGFVIRQECIAALRKKFNEVRDETTTNIDDLDGGSFSVDTEDRTKSTAGRCLPDTLDLRGPKGK